MSPSSSASESIPPPKYIRFTLRKSDNTLAANEDIKYATFLYANDNLNDAAWMEREQKGNITTDANGTVEILYTGVEELGGLVYITVIRSLSNPEESLCWTAQVVE